MGEIEALLNAYEPGRDDHERGINWPTGRESVEQLRLERTFSRRLKLMGFRLIADRTQFTDPHYRGGYQIASAVRVESGRDYELSLMDVEAWIAQKERNRGRNRAK